MRRDDYTTVTAAAKQFGISPRHLRYLLQRGIIEGVKPSRDWLVRPSAVAEYLRRGVKPGPKPHRPRGSRPKLSPISAISEFPSARTVTVPEAARLSGLSRSHLRNLVRRGAIRGQKVGRDWVLTLREVMAYRRRAKRGRPRER